MLFVREGILLQKFPNRDSFVEINLRKKKWLLSFSYNPNRENIENPLET